VLKVMVGLGELIAVLLLLAIAALLVWWIRNLARKFYEDWRERRFRKEFEQMGGDLSNTEYLRWREEQRKKGARFW